MKYDNEIVIIVLCYWSTVWLMWMEWQFACLLGKTFHGWGNNEAQSVIQFIGISEYVSYGVKIYYVIM